LSSLKKFLSPWIDEAYSVKCIQNLIILKTSQGMIL